MADIRHLLQFFFIFLFSFSLVFTSCNQDNTSDSESAAPEAEPLVEGFDYSKSDTAAVSIANEVMKALGGRKNWNKARFFTWNFFGEQRHFWDRQTGDIRIESLSSNLIILMNVHSKKGKVFVNGQEITQADSLKKYMDMGVQMWENDSYWLVMPFRLIEPGVMLKYLDEDVAQTGETADVIEVSFTSGPFTGKKYLVYVDKVNRFVIQWSIYSKADNEDPTLVTGWSDYEKYHNIWLASGRGRHEITDIAVVDSFPAHTFTAPQPVSVY
jgi:hypothetical protein